MSNIVWDDFSSPYWSPEKGTGYKTNGINNSEIAEAIGKSRQYVQYKLKEIQKKLKKYF